MQILAIERKLPSAPPITTEQILRVEAACVWDLQKRGIIRDIWFTTTGNHAVIMLECASATEARQYLAMLPLVHAGVIDFTVHELRGYDGLERLFAHRLSPDANASKRKRVKEPGRSKPARSPKGLQGSPSGPPGGGRHSRTPTPAVSIKS